jgi:signal transduction histidine kinase/ActR/RegA family two-component response regulator
MTATYATLALAVITALTLAALYIKRRVHALQWELADTHLQLQAVLDNMAEGVVVIDPDRNIVLVNRIGSTLISITPEKPSYAAAEEQLEAFTSEGDPLPFDQWPSSRALRGDFVQNFRVHHRNRITGEASSRIMSTAPLPGPRGKAGQVILSYRDDTKTRNLERQLQQAQKMEAIGQLTGGIAHDFNNLLAIVSGNLDLLESLIADNEPALARTASARKAASRAADLTRRLLAFSSQEVLNPVATHLDHSVRNALEIAIHALGPEIEISIDLSATLLPVFIDPSGLENALLNLFVNARDAMSSGGKLHIATKSIALDGTHPHIVNGSLTPGAYALVSVSDNGHGMSKATLERVFEPFFTTKERGRGTGLGLAMVYGFARQSKGHIQLYSEPGHGTTVSLYLPFALHAQEELTAEAPVQLKLMRTGGKILLVDDEHDLLDISSAYLNKLGYETLLATNAAHALHLVDEHPGIDVIVTDIVMPGSMNGIDLTRAIAQRNPEIKSIYTSGFPADALAEKNFTVDGHTLLNKPYRLCDLANAIARTMSEEP